MARSPLSDSVFACFSHISDESVALMHWFRVHAMVRVQDRAGVRRELRVYLQFAFNANRHLLPMAIASGRPRDPDRGIHSRWRPSATLVRTSPPATHPTLWVASLSCSHPILWVASLSCSTSRSRASSRPGSPRSLSCPASPWRSGTGWACRRQWLPLRRSPLRTSASWNRPD